LRVVFLGSGSSGNAAAVTDGTTTVLVDCGFSAREIARRLAFSGITPSSVSAILVTHEHSDHISGIDVYARRHACGCCVYASAGTGRRLSLGASVPREAVRCGDPFSIGSLRVTPFRTSHDASEPLGYRFDSGTESLGIVTDTGVLTPESLETLAGVTILGLESNHDVVMLERGPYPAFLKRRIRSHAGHLSNDDAAAALELIASDALTRVFALHRSRTNNTAALAEKSLTDSMRRLGLDVPVTIAAQGDPSDSHPAQGALFDEAGR
jgi:phosphoribosyl 1,2-cyclic phosphodiesterase